MAHRRLGRQTGRNSGSSRISFWGSLRLWRAEMASRLPELSATLQAWEKLRRHAGAMRRISSGGGISAHFPHRAEALKQLGDEESPTRADAALILGMIRGARVELVRNVDVGESTSALSGCPAPHGERFKQPGIKFRGLNRRLLRTSKHRAHS